MRYSVCIALGLAMLLSDNGALAQAGGQPAPPPRVLLFFSLNVEADHALFATDALNFFAEVGDKNNLHVEATSNWSDMNDENLKQYQLVVWLNSLPPSAQQQAFQRYMEAGGAWLPFHPPAYNHSNSRCPLFKNFT